MGTQYGESIVLNGEHVQKLRNKRIVKDSLTVKNKYSTEDSNVIYAEGIDYCIDYGNGSICRLAGSSIPNWEEHVLFGKENFDHEKYEEYSNNKYTVYVDYGFEGKGDFWQLYSENIKSNYENLENIKNKLQQGIKIKYLVYGDSISTGCEATKEEFMYFNKLSKYLEKKYVKSNIEVINRAKGGEASFGGLERLHNEVLSEKPDLITIGYGMNDQNIDDSGTPSVPIPQFKSNMDRMVKLIKENTGADIILITPCIPNPLWKHSGNFIHEYAQAIREIAADNNTALCDVYRVWTQEIVAGKPFQSLLQNNINHPNDYGQDLYYKALKELL